ncbi:hypothetical protein [Rubellicoccus peritrichatus]|uniref:AMIN domain-containing protein n=1 Tax=Rubellicoccus peritrichatus TaxID=3080537 RepID=A0AAQ3L6U4_9BACT|nr:hypothetical protein [Puniceicoccus sp. CR14]WOO40086.1 hypothetical protein RZN69_15805 [Puniceicoccus sp. CR14]
MVKSRRSLGKALLVFCAIASITASAQSVDEPVRFRLLSLFGSLSFLYETEDGPKRMYTSSSSFSSWYEAPDNRRLNFYREVPAPEPELPPVKHTLADLTLPSGPGPFLVVLMKKSDGEGLNSIILDHSLEAHPPSRYRAFNFSKRRMAVRLAEQDILLEPSGSALVNYPEGRKTWLKIAVDQPDTGWIKVVSKPRPVDNQTRSTIVILDIPPSVRDLDPIGVIVREVREQIVEGEQGSTLQ